MPWWKYLTPKKLSNKGRKLIFIPPPQPPPLLENIWLHLYLKWTLDNVQSFIEQHAVPDTQQYTVNLYLSNNEKDIVVLNSDNFLHCCANINIPKSPCLKKPELKIVNYQLETKLRYLFQIRQRFKGCVKNMHAVIQRFQALTQISINNSQITLFK